MQPKCCEIAPLICTDGAVIGSRAVPLTAVSRLSSRDRHLSRATISADGRLLSNQPVKPTTAVFSDGQ